jgi:hypothetical protein
VTVDMTPDAVTGIATHDQALLAGVLACVADDQKHQVRVVGTTELCRGVYRLEVAGAVRPSIVVKRLAGRQAQLEQRLTDRWLPDAGLDGLGPPRLAAVPDADGHHVWHVYDDLAGWGLDRPDPEAATLVRAMTRLADLHATFATHALLPEARFTSGDLGAHFFSKSVRDAVRSIELLRPPAMHLSPDQERVRDGVLERLSLLLDDEPARVRMLEQDAGPETLLHGDLTRENLFVLPGPGPQQVRLIDWDHVGVGPAGFDVSTHLRYYAAEQRQLVLDSYTRAMAERGFPLHDLDWELLVATFEAGRLANQVIWVALGILEGNGWNFEHLAQWELALADVVDRSGRALPGRGAT